MKWLKYELSLILLEYRYGRKLAKIARERYQNCNLGLTFTQRAAVHRWVNIERNRLYKKYHE